MITLRRLVFSQFGKQALYREEKEIWGIYPGSGINCSMPRRKLSSVAGVKNHTSTERTVSFGQVYGPAALTGAECLTQDDDVRRELQQL
jgi:hypothetical protein